MITYQQEIWGWVPSQATEPMISKTEKIEVVGHCCFCGKPIYGPKQADVVGPPIQVQPTCFCRASKTIDQMMQRK